MHKWRSFPLAHGVSLCRGVQQLHYRSIVTIQVTPEQSLGDERFQTIVKGLKPKSEVTLKLDVTNKHKVHFSSSINYQCTSSGQLDLDVDPPHSHPLCKEADGMLPFWSMKPAAGSDFRFCSSQANDPYQCHYQVLDANGSVIAETHFQRLLMAPGVKRIVVKEGRLRGTLFLPAGDGPFPAVIKLYGGIHRGNVFEEKGAMLASRGFACFVMAYAGMEGQPKNILVKVKGRPLEFDVGVFEEAVDYLRGLPTIQKSSGVGFIGISKGCELALCAAAFLPRGKISSVVALAGWTHLIMNDLSYKGQKVLDGNQIDMSQHSSKVKFVGEKLINIRAISEDIEIEGIKSVIPFHKKTDIRYMFVAGGDDQNHNATGEHQYAKKLIKEAGLKGCQFHEYQSLGHVISLPYDPPLVTMNHVAYPKDILIEMGGSSDLKGHVEAQVDIWNKILQFLSKTLS